MDNEIKDLVLGIVRENVAKRLLFTAHDVTRAARGKTRKNVRHEESKAEVHAEMQASLSSGSYLRDLIDVGKPDMPYLYYPAGEDPSNYVGQGSGRFAAIANMAPAALPAGDSDRRQDGRGRITVPNTLLRDIGLRHKNIAYVVADAGKLTVFAREPDDYTASYYMDKDDNIRISGVVVQQANLNAKSYDFSVENDTVVITEG